MGNKGERGIVVAKIGTDTLVRAGRADAHYALTIAEQIWQVRDQGTDVVLVSSGAGALGGQDALTSTWRSAFADHGLVAEEILFREASFGAHVSRVRDTLTDGRIPVVNGDTAIHLGRRTTNNDFLAAAIARRLDASAAFLTRVEGVLDRDCQVISHLASQSTIVDFGHTVHGTGGMAAKVDAARLVAAGGREALIAHGRRPNVIVDFVEGNKQFGTRIAA